MTISTIISELEKFAPLYLQEDYDNSGLIIGDNSTICNGILLALDTTEEVVLEAIEKKCNLIIAHHPIVFKGIKKLTEKNGVNRAFILAIKNDIAVYACHTNLDNVIDGVNGKIADKLGLTNRSILSPKANMLHKLAVYVPVEFEEKVEQALFSAGAGHVGNYSECSFISDGIGSFKPEENSNPATGQIGIRTKGHEKKIEVIYPSWLQHQIIRSLKLAHPYEEVAYEITSLHNIFQQVGAGIIGELIIDSTESDFLNSIKNIFNTSVIKHTSFSGKMIKKVAICGGSGSFLLSQAIAQGADIFITSDVKYHEFFEADNQIILADLGHFESEQFTIDLFADFLRQNFPNFAILKTGVNTNPVRYFI